MSEAKRLSEAEQLAWGAEEHRIRIADIAAVKDREITLEEAQTRARQRSRASGMSPARAYRAIRDGSSAALNPPTQSHLAGKGEL